MNDKLKLLNILFCLLLVMGCGRKHNNYELSEIRIKYVKSHIEDERLNCDDFKKEFFLERKISDTILTDTIVLDKINQIIQNFNKQNNQKERSVDTRIHCLLIYDDGSTITLCLGQYFGTLIDGELVQDNLDLNFLIKQYSGYYNYFPKQNLIYFLELKDSVLLKRALIENNFIISKEIDSNDPISEIQW